MAVTRMRCFSAQDNFIQLGGRKIEGRAQRRD
jgi:hypothetical protein